jgi:flagellar basal-body rod protein FlgB
VGNSFFSDDAMRAARLALDGLSLRQQVVGRNVANVDTPGYHAQSVDFESALKRVFNRSKNGLGLQATQEGHMGAPKEEIGFQVKGRPGGSFRADENNVDIDAELLEMSEAGIQYQAVAESLTKKLQLLKTIASSR